MSDFDILYYCIGMDALVKNLPCMYWFVKSSFVLNLQEKIMEIIQKNDFYLVTVVVLALAILLATDYWLFQSQNQQTKDLQVVKSQLLSSKSSLINFPAADYRLVIVFSILSLIVGAAGGFWIGCTTIPSKNEPVGFRKKGSPKS